MLVTLDKRGSINLPAALRKELRLKSGSHLSLEIIDGGIIMIQPVAIFPTIRLSDQGLAKLREARQSGTAQLPSWFAGDMKNARTDTDEEVPKRP